MLTIAKFVIIIKCQEKWSGKAPRAIDVYKEAILMNVLHF